jgi:WD40 repeat protein
LPAALNSITMCESGIVDNNVKEPAHVLATAGTTNVINLWKVALIDHAKVSTVGSNIFQKPSLSSANNVKEMSSTAGSEIANITASVSPSLGCVSTKIEFLCSLSRHDGPVNSIQFSPDGLHLATGGENGLIIWSVPVLRRANGNGRHHWSTVTSESELLVKIVSFRSGSICDISWSTDSKRILIGTIDHTIVCCEDDSYDVNHCITTSADNNSPLTSVPTSTTMRIASQKMQIASEWKIIYEKDDEHNHYIQGVSYDPLGVYFASMSADRTVRILQRKPRVSKKTLRSFQPPHARAASRPSSNNSVDIVNSEDLPEDNQRAASRIAVQELLTNSKLDMGTMKAKQIKYRKTLGPDGSIVSKQNLYIDETTLESSVRRLSWTNDGAFLITPAALWHEDAIDRKSNVQFATLVFARHRFEEPYRVLPGLEKVSGFSQSYSSFCRILIDDGNLILPTLTPSLIEYKTCFALNYLAVDCSSRQSSSVSVANHRLDRSR